MLYKFKSKVSSDVIMLEANGRQILQIWGKWEEGAPAKGILLPEDMPAAKAALEAAIASEEAQRAQASLDAQARGENTQIAGISLRQRAMPMLDMLQRSLKAQKEIVWGT
jgi:regulator of protease activity HflC (stomatin/prohibitin superfamily)